MLEFNNSATSSGNYNCHFDLGFNIVFHHKGDLATGKWGEGPETLVEQFLFTISTNKKLRLRRASRYTVSPNRKEAGFQYVIVGTKY